MDPTNSRAMVATLGVTQTLAWASSYYLPAILVPPMASAFGLQPSTVFAAFSAALVIAAVVGPAAGAAIDRFGGRIVLCATNVVFACGLALLAIAPDVATLVVGWLVLGVGMGSGLYEAAFAALVRLKGSDARGAITGVTLFAGFASTVGWPLSSWFVATLDWRGACLAWAALHLVVGLPLNALWPRGSTSPVARQAVPAGLDVTTPMPTRPVPRRTAWVLAYVFAATWFIATAMAAHLPRLMQALGATFATAVLIGTLVGPAQVVARLLEYGVLRRAHPLWSARIATLLHPIGAVVLLTFGAPAAGVFAILHGGGNGILTIAKGMLPLALFGPAGYGRMQGVLTVPARVAQALAPWLFGLALERWGAGALWLSATLGASAFGMLWLLPHAKPERDERFPSARPI